jgi:hypothetical protein
MQQSTRDDLQMQTGVYVGDWLVEVANCTASWFNICRAEIQPCELDGSLDQL